MDYRTKEEQVADYLRERIISGVFPRGSRLKQAEIAEQLNGRIELARHQLSTALNVSQPTGFTLAAAFAAYEVAIRKEYSSPTGALQTWGKTQIDELKSITNYLSDKRFGGLSLSTYADVMRGGKTGKIVEPGESAASLLTRRVLADDLSSEGEK